MAERDKVSIPPELRPLVMEYFDANSDSGTIVQALWYAVERYEVEHGIHPSDRPAHENIDSKR